MRKVRCADDGFQRWHVDGILWLGRGIRRSLGLLCSAVMGTILCLEGCCRRSVRAGLFEEAHELLLGEVLDDIRGMDLIERLRGNGTGPSQQNCSERISEHDLDKFNQSPRHTRCPSRVIVDEVGDIPYFGVHGNPAIGLGVVLVQVNESDSALSAG